MGHRWLCNFRNLTYGGNLHPSVVSTCLLSVIGAILKQNTVFNGWSWETKVSVLKQFRLKTTHASKNDAVSFVNEKYWHKAKPLIQTHTQIVVVTMIAYTMLKNKNKKCFFGYISEFLLENVYMLLFNKQNPEENRRNIVHILDFMAVVTINLDGAYYYAINMCRMSNVVFSTCFELSRNWWDYFLIGDLRCIN